MKEYRFLLKDLKRTGTDKKIDEFLEHWEETPVFGKELYNKFVEFIDKNNDYYITETGFGVYLSTKEIPKIRTGKGVCYFGNPLKGQWS